MLSMENLMTKGQEGHQLVERNESGFYEGIITEHATMFLQYFILCTG